MAVYKVIQDIESEDKLLGPLTLKGLVYAMIAGVLLFIDVRLFISGAPTLIKFIIGITLLFPIILFAVLASPLGRDQPTEVWLLSYIKFFLITRKRIWDQSGSKEMVTITAPKKIERHLTKDMSQKEVNSRLKALALTLDSRGWAVKNVNVNMDDADIDARLVKPDTDRLVDNSSVNKTPLPVDIKASDDILDAQSNPTAKKFDNLMKQQKLDQKHDLMQKLKHSFIKEPVKKHTPARHDHKAKARQKLADKPVKSETIKPMPAKVTDTSQADKLELIKTAKDFNYKISTVANLAARQPKVIQLGPNEVEIDLH